MQSTHTGASMQHSRYWGGQTSSTPAELTQSRENIREKEHFEQNRDRKREIYTQIAISDLIGTLG